MRISDLRAIKTGIPVIDKQHEEYADLVDRFFRMALHGNVDRRKLSKEMGKVLTYAVEHFDSEEQLMFSLNYPQYEEHRAQHDAFRLQTDSWVVEVNSAQDINAITLPLSKFLVNWFCEHVQRDDLKLANFIKSSSWVI